MRAASAGAADEQLELVGGITCPGREIGMHVAER